MTGTLQIQDIIVRQINRLGLSSPAAHIEQMRYELLQINLMKLEVRVIVLMIIKLHYYHGSWQCLKRLSKHTPTPFLESESKHCYLLHPSRRSYQSHSTLHFTTWGFCHTFLTNRVDPSFLQCISTNLISYQHLHECHFLASSLANFLHCFSCCHWAWSHLQRIQLVLSLLTYSRSRVATGVLPPAVGSKSNWQAPGGTQLSRTTLVGTASAEFLEATNGNSTQMACCQQSPQSHHGYLTSCCSCAYSNFQHIDWDAERQHRKPFKDNL